ncbi:unnamed protein product [Closterium sp. NIES-54]
MQARMRDGQGGAQVLGKRAGQGSAGLAGQRDRQGRVARDQQGGATGRAGRCGASRAAQRAGQSSARPAGRRAGNRAAHGQQGGARAEKSSARAGQGGAQRAGQRDGQGRAGQRDWWDVGAGGAGGLGAGGAVAGDAGGTGAGGARGFGDGEPPPTSTAEQTDSLTKRREPSSRPASPVARPARIVQPPLVPSEQTMALRPSSVAQRPVLPSPPTSSLPDVSDLESGLDHAASPTVTHCLATLVTDPTFQGHHGSELLSVVDSHRRKDGILASKKYTYVDAVPPPGANIVDGMWIFRVNRPPGSPPVFKARYVAPGFSLRHGVYFFQTFSPTPKVTTLRVLLHVATQHDYELLLLKFSTAFLQGSLHDEIWLRRPTGFTGSFPEGTLWSLSRSIYSLCQAPREWHDTLRTTFAALGCTSSTADPSLFLRTDPSLPPFYILVYVNKSVFATVVTEALALVKAELQKGHTCTDLGELRSYLSLQVTRDRAARTITLTQSHMVHQHFDFQFSSPQPTLLLTNHSVSAPPSDESVESSGRCHKIEFPLENVALKVSTAGAVGAV